MQLESWCGPAKLEDNKRLKLDLNLSWNVNEKGGWLPNLNSKMSKKVTMFKTVRVVFVQAYSLAS